MTSPLFCATLNSIKRIHTSKAVTERVHLRSVLQRTPLPGESGRLRPNGPAPDRRAAERGGTEPDGTWLPSSAPNRRADPGRDDGRKRQGCDRFRLLQRQGMSPDRKAGPHPQRYDPREGHMNGSGTTG